MEELKPLIEWGLEVFKALAAFGPLGKASVFLMLAVRFLQTDFIQSLLPEQVRWSRLKPWVKVAIPVGGSLLAACLALLGGASAPLIVPYALVVAGGAILGHHMTKKLGTMVAESALKKNPFYEPGAVRRVASIVFPLPKIDDKLLDKRP